MLKNFSIISFVLIAFIFISCSKSSPITPDSSTQNGHPTRLTESFDEVKKLFGESDPAATADVAEIIQGPGLSESDCGFPWEYENPSEEKWVVVVTRVFNDPDYGIEYRFAGQDTDNLSNILELEDSSATPIEGDLRLPRIASCFFEDGDDDFVEVTIVFQWREGDDPWGIRVVRMSIDPAGFEDDPPDLTATCIEDHIIDIDGMWGDIMPDVDYDPRGDYGDLWICFTRWTNMFKTTSGIFMVEARRNQSDYTDVVWGNSGNTGAVELTTGANGWLPRIAIGKCGIVELEEDWNKVIAYTAQLSVFHTGIIYCDVDWNLYYPPEDLHQFIVTHWIWGDCAGGCPMVDIGPPGINFGAVVWTQTRDDMNKNDATISYGDNRGGYGVIHETAGEGAPASCMGSIAIHNDDSGDVETAISYIRCQNPSLNNDWLPYAIFFEANEGGGSQSFTSTERLISNAYKCKWDDAFLANHYFGMSTALTVFDDNYWMVWSAYTSGPTPDEIYGTYGYIY